MCSGRHTRTGRGHTRAPRNEYLARGYTAVGDTRNAIANWEIAIKNRAENQTVNLPVYEQALKALKEKS